MIRQVARVIYMKPLNYLLSSNTYKIYAVLFLQHTMNAFM